MENINSGDTAWVLASAALVMLMTPALGFFYGGLVRRKNVLATIMHSFFILALISVQWVLWGYTLAFGPDIGGIIGGLDWLGLRGVGAGAERRLRGDDPALGLHGLPDDVRRDHPGADHRRLRRAQALQGVRHLHPALGDARLRPGRALGLGRRRLAARCSARSTSPAAPSSTSPRGVSALVAAMVLGKRIGFGKEPMEPHDLTDDRARRRAALVRLVRLQRRQRARRERPGGERLRRHQHRRGDGRR